MSLPADNPPYFAIDTMTGIEPPPNSEDLAASRTLSPYVPRYLSLSLRVGNSHGISLGDDFVADGMEAFPNREGPVANESFSLPTREAAASQPGDFYISRDISRYGREDRPHSTFDVENFTAELMENLPAPNYEGPLANESSSLPTREGPTASRSQNSCIPDCCFQTLGDNNGQRIFPGRGSEVLNPSPPVHELPADLEPCLSTRESLMRKHPRSFRLTLTIILHMFYLEGKSAQEITDHFQGQGTSLSKIFVQTVTGATVPSGSTTELMARFEEAVKRTDEQMDTLKAWFEDKWGGEN